MSTMFKVFVGNIGFDTTEDDIRKIFEPHIVIEDVVIAREQDTGQQTEAGTRVRDSVQHVLIPFRRCNASRRRRPTARKYSKGL